MYVYVYMYVNSSILGIEEVNGFNIFHITINVQGTEMLQAIQFATSVFFPSRRCHVIWKWKKTSTRLSFTQLNNPFSLSENSRTNYLTSITPTTSLMRKYEDISLMAYSEINGN